MKQSITSILVFASLAIYVQTYAQMDYYAVPWSIWLYDETTNQAIADADVDATIVYKDVDGNTVFMESHTGVTNAHGHFVFKVGNGVPLSGTLTARLYKEITRFGYTLHVVYHGDTKTIEGEQEVCAAGKANAALFSCDAGNAFGLGGFVFVSQAVNFGSVVCPPIEDTDLDYYALFSRRDKTGIRPDQLIYSPLSNLVRMKKAKHFVTDETIDFLSFGLGLGKPVYCGPDPEFIYAMHGITMPSLKKYPYGVDLRVQREDNVTDPTATLNCENLNANGIGGRFFSSTGVLGYGGNGIVGVAQGTGTGTGIYGTIGTEPATGQSKYAGFFTNNGHGMSYSVYHNGPWIMTEAGMLVSDRSFKENIQPLGSIMEKVNQLHPDTYEMKEDPRFHFSKGLHYGFIAQEVESIFPQLVSDVLLPTSINFETNAANGTESHKAINYTGLIPILTASIQELDAKVVSLTSELDETNKIIAELKARIETLEKK